MGNLTEEDKQYLLSRAYTEEMLALEPFSSVKKGEYPWPDIVWKSDYDCIALLCRSMSGDPAGVHTLCRQEKRYGYHKINEKDHLPILYATEDDYRELYISGRLAITEGIFDRVAIKRCFPNTAVFARLSKGTSNVLSHVLLRYATEILAMFDMDQPGRAAILDMAKKLGSNVAVREVRFPRKDPAEMYNKDGQSKLCRYVLDEISRMI